MKPKLKALIIDDESRCRSSLKKQLEWYCEHIEVIGEAENAAAGKQLILSNQVDVVFLDIDMPDKTGIEMLKELGEISSYIIFTTAYDVYAIQAFKVNAIDYLLKPILEEDLVDAVRKIERKKREDTLYDVADVLSRIEKTEKESIAAVPVKDGFQFIEKKSILRLEGDGAYCKIYFDNGGKILVSKTMKKVIELIDSHELVRVHNSHTIHIKKIAKYIKTDGGYLILKDGSQIPMSRTKKTDFLQRLSFS